MDNYESSKLKLSIKLLSYLYNKNYRVKGSELSEIFGLSSRSIRRIINDLRDIGYDIESISGPYGGYRLNKSNIILPVKLSDLEMKHWQTITNTMQASDISDKDEVLNLLNIISIQSQLETSYSPDIYTTKKLRDDVREKIDSISTTLSNAINNKQRVEIKYLNSDWREFRPHQFQIFNNILYIKGYYDSNSNSFRTLRLSRFKDARLISKKYSFNENFERDNDDSAFSKNVYKSYDVSMKVYKINLDLLDYQYGDHQEIIEYDDYYIVNFTLEGDRIIKELILSLGKQVELLKPESIREEIKDELSYLHNLYKEEDL